MRATAAVAVSCAPSVPPSSPFFLNPGEWWLVPTPIMAENGDALGPKTTGARRQQSLSLGIVTTTSQSSALLTLGGTGGLPAHVPLARTRAGKPVSPDRKFGREIPTRSLAAGRHGHTLQARSLSGDPD